MPDRPRRKREPQSWQTFVVRVRRARGRAEIRAEVELVAIYGAGTPRPLDRRIVWSGVISAWDGESPLTPEEAAELASAALRRAYPALF